MKLNKIKFGAKEFLFTTLFLAVYAVIFFSADVISLIAPDSQDVTDSQQVSSDTANLLLSLDSITLDTSVLNIPYLQSIAPLPSFALDANNPQNFGKANPFTGSFLVVTSAATSTVGGVAYSAQRTSRANITPVRTTTTR